MFLLLLLQMTPEDSENYLELKALIRRKALLDEIENIQDELQILRYFHCLHLILAFYLNCDGKL